MAEKPYWKEWIIALVEGRGSQRMLKCYTQYLRTLLESGFIDINDIGVDFWTLIAWMEVMDIDPSKLILRFNDQNVNDQAQDPGVESS